MPNRNQPSGETEESFTRRDLDILTLLAQDLSDREIADRLSLALSTVKWYARQVYTKLGVNQRSEVAERARELGLLQPTPAPSPGEWWGKNNLPAPLTSFIGREREVSELSLRLKKKETRFLTLTGSGGTGKTRLAIEVAGELTGAFPDGVWLVELASLADPVLVPQAIIGAFGWVEPPNRTPLAFLRDFLREKQLLLILDNCEHLVDACAELAGHLLQEAPRLKILVTSREILGVSGEIPYRVPPLAVPDMRRLPAPNDLGDYDAVRLFVDRARTVNPAFEITLENSAAVAQITQRLDGIPLALELAAARLRLLSVSQIAQRLDDVFRLLTGGNRTDLPRHQTLQALIDWSYNLLTEAERELLRRLSVFAGGWTLEAAENVCIGSAEVLNLLGQLTDKSIILTIPTPGGEMRYRMLETVRQYAHARLVEAGVVSDARRRQLDYYLCLGEKLEPKLRSRDQLPALDLLGREIDNIRFALEWGMQADIEAGLRLASALEWFWLLLPHELEGSEWLEKGLEAEAFSRGGQPPAAARAGIRAKALTVLGHLLFGMEDPGSEKAKRILAEALSLYRSCGSEYLASMAWAILWSGQSQLTQGNSAEGLPLVKEALRLFRESGNSPAIAECLFSLGDWETDTERQKPIFVEALAIEQANGDTHGIVHAHFSLGVCANLDGEYENALAEFAASRAYARETGNSWKVAFGGLLHSFVSHHIGDLERADRYLDEALAGFREIVDKRQVAFCLIWKALIAFAQGDTPLVAELTEECSKIAHKIGDAGVQTQNYYLRARLARLNGDRTAARRMVEEGLSTRPDLGADRMWLLLEQGHLAFENDDLTRVDVLWRECMRILLDFNMTHWMVYPLEAMALLALREGRYERAARLFGTRQAVAASHFLSPSERGARETGLAEIQSALGAERFAQLQAEGKAMTFSLVLALAQEI